MQRRNFLRYCASAVAAGAGVWVMPPPPPPTPGPLAAKAHDIFMPGQRTCAEAVLAAGCETLGVDSPLVPDMAIGLGGGVGLQGETCGVLTAAAMVISLAVAAREQDYKARKKKTMAATGRLHRDFKARFAATDCRTLCGLDLTTPEGRTALEERVKAETCAPLVEARAAMLDRQLEAVRQKPGRIRLGG